MNDNTFQIPGVRESDPRRASLGWNERQEELELEKIDLLKKIASDMELAVRYLASIKARLPDPFIKATAPEPAAPGQPRSGAENSKRDRQS